MKRALIILLIGCLPVLQGCYLQRYYSLKKEYEVFRKDLNKVRSRNSQLKAIKQSKTDSIEWVNRSIVSLRRGIVYSDSLAEAYSLQIRKALGDDPWGDSIKKAANTALSAKFNSDNERNVIYWLNIARLQPDLFAEMYLDPYIRFYKDDDWICCGEGGWGMGSNVIYLNTCYLDMAKMKPLNVLIPDEENYLSAECHATESGKTGYVGHDRTNCKKHFSGECCHYGSTNGIDVILNLLIDTGVPSLGHRHICLGSYDKIGVSQKPHLTYRSNTVLDFD
jgi:hypothetical protein